MQDIICMDFSGQYKELVADIIRQKLSITHIDCSDMEGTNSYCDESAKCQIRERIRKQDVCGIRFLDSGNYHYLSLFWMEKIKKDFALVLFDHHSDRQESAFGDLLSCGSWVKVATECLPHLKKVYWIGVDEIPEEEITNDLPLYISIDKDILSKEYASCDWDQGTMSLQELKVRLQKLFLQPIIGIDICGEKKTNPSDEERVKNLSTNQSLLSLILHSCDSWHPAF